MFHQNSELISFNRVLNEFECGCGYEIIDQDSNADAMQWVLVFVCKCKIMKAQYADLDTDVCADVDTETKICAFLKPWLLVTMQLI